MARAPVRLGRRQLLVMAAGLALAPLDRRAVRAESATASAEAVIQDLSERTWALLQRRDLDQRARIDQLSQLIAARTDVALLGRLALGRHWRGLSEAQRERYGQLFHAVVIPTLARRLDQSANGARGPLEEHFRVATAQPVGKDDVLVRSKVRTQGGEALAVDWRLRVQDGTPVIIDLIIEGVSLLVTQRSEFAAVIERRGIDGLLTELSAHAPAAGS